MLARHIAEELQMERRRFLKVLGVGALAALPLLQACSNSSSPTQPAATQPAAGGAAPKPTTATANAPANPAASGATPSASPAAAAKPTAAAQAAPAKTGATREVSFMSIGNEGDQKMFQEALAAAQKESLDAQNIKVNFQPGPASGPDAWAKVMTMFAGNQAFDVQRIDDDRVYLLATENKIHQLDKMMTDLGLKKDAYYPAFFTTLNLEGYQFSMNPAGGANVVYYNKDLFDAAGVKAPESWKDAWTWDQFAENARKLAKVSNGNTDVYALAFPPNISTPTGYGAGATAFNADETQCGFGGDDVFNAIDPIVQMVVKEKIIAPPELGDAGRLQLFNAGKIAMTWESMGFDQNVSKSIKWDVMPWMKTPKYAMTENYDRTFVISKTAKDPEAAFLALKALCERAAGDVFAQHHFGLPYFKASAEDPAVNDPNVAPAHKAVWRETFDNVDGHPVDVPTPRSPVGEVWKDSFTADLFNSALSGQISTRDFLAQVSQKVNDKIAELKWHKGAGLEALKAGGGLTNPETKFFS
jgi:multiple sugar transport system substrate-binding protein